MPNDQDLSLAGRSVVLFTNRAMIVLRILAFLLWWVNNFYMVKRTILYYVMCKWKTDRPSLKGIFRNVQVYRWQILTDSTYIFFLPTATFLVCLLAGAQYEHHATSCLSKFHWKYLCDYICSSRNHSVAIQMLDMSWKCLLSTPDLPGIQKWSIKKIQGMPRYNPDKCNVSIYEYSLWQSMRDRRDIEVALFLRFTAQMYWSPKEYPTGSEAFLKTEVTMCFSSVLISIPCAFLLIISEGSGGKCLIL